MTQIHLSSLLSYQNDRVISRYIKDYPLAKMSAEDAFNELMKYIWLSMKHKNDKKAYPNDHSLNFMCTMHHEMKDIDNMWHTFLLFTQDYHNFCQEYLDGVFFHHEPQDETDYFSEQVYEQELTLYLSYIYDNLGEDALIKWFNPYE
jgi:hypothetical protein